jgi:hypothetical protein
MEPRNRRLSRVPTRSEHAEGNIVDAGMGRRRRTRRGRRPLHVPKHGVRNPGGPASGLAIPRQVRTVHPRGTTVMHGCRESDRCRVPRKPANKGCPKEPAEEVEGRERAKGNAAAHTRDRTPGRVIPVTRARPRTAGPFGACTSDPRQEPGAVVPHAGICAGGAG